jgi:hypothetical protein
VFNLIRDKGWRVVYAAALHFRAVPFHGFGV